MNIDWADVVVPAAVAVVVSPFVQYLATRRSDQAQGAFAARKEFYDDLLAGLSLYVEYVKGLPPNARTPRPGDPDPKNQVIVQPELQNAMRLHASPVLSLQVIELVNAADEAKWQSDYAVRERARADALPPDSFEREWARHRYFQHCDRKHHADQWTAQCLENVRFRMRYELYGWRRRSPIATLRARRASKRMTARRTDRLGGGVPLDPPPGQRELWESKRTINSSKPPSAST